MYFITFFIKSIKLVSRKALLFSLIAGLAYSGATLYNAASIHEGNASFAAIISLLDPIFLLIFGLIIFKEKINNKTLLGIFISLIGCAIVIAYPLLKSSINYPITAKAASMALFSSITLPIFIIYSKKANKEGMPLISVLGIVFVIVAITSLTVSTFSSEALPSLNQLLSRNVLVVVLYSGLIVSFASRYLTIVSYKYINTASLSGLFYLPPIISIALPMIFLKETLSFSLFFGAFITMLGLFITEHFNQEKLNNMIINFSKYSRNVSKIVLNLRF